MQSLVYETDYSKANIKVLSASDVDQATLFAFYKVMYPQRADFLRNNWRWLNRSYFFKDRIPLVLVSERKVIAHAGMIPAVISVCGHEYTAAWFIDLSVLPEVQRSGYGSILVNKRMEFTDIQMTFPNQRSSGIFKKLGWKESAESYMHYVLISPFNHPRIIQWLPKPVRSLLNALTFSTLKTFYIRYAFSITDNNLIVLNEDTLELFLNAFDASFKHFDDVIFPIRNDDFIQWRISSSPNRSKYYVCYNNDISSIVFFNDLIANSIDILWVSDLNNKNGISKIISALAIYGRKRGYSYVRFYTTKNEVSNFIKNTTKSLVKIRKFVYYSKNKSLLDRLANFKWDLELIDSDFEHTN